jgi:hypothetical protein
MDAGNWQATERLLAEIRAANPNYPGLAALTSRVENEKAKSKTLNAAPVPTPAPAPESKPLQNASLATKLQEAESYLNATNWQAAERLFWEIRAADANYPGLDALNSRIQNLKSRLNGQM